MFGAPETLKRLPCCKSNQATGLTLKNQVSNQSPQSWSEPKEMDLHANLFSSSFPGRRGMTLKQNTGGFLSEWLQPSQNPPLPASPGMEMPARSWLFPSSGSFAAALPSGKGPHRGRPTCTMFQKGPNEKGNVSKEHSREVVTPPWE